MGVWTFLSELESILKVISFSKTHWKIPLLFIVLVVCNIIPIKSNIAIAATPQGRPVHALVYDTSKKYPNYYFLFYTEQLLNQTLTNLSASINGGKLTISFGVDPEKWPGMSVRAIGHVKPPHKLRVIYYDESGQYLGRFVTAELFAPNWVIASCDTMAFVSPSGKFEYVAGDCLPLNSDVNSFTYSVNRRDADYIQYVTIGFYVPGSDKDFIQADLLIKGEAEYLKKLSPEEKSVYDINRKHGVPSKCFEWIRGQIFRIHDTYGEKNRALYDALLTENTTIMDWLYEVGKFDHSDKFELMYGILRGEKLQAAEWLVKKGVSPTIANSEGKTALHLFAENHNSENKKMVQWLIKNGMDLNLKDNNGMSALELALAKCNINFINTLIINGANTNVRDKNGDDIITSLEKQTKGDTYKKQDFDKYKDNWNIVGN